jgi:hypothetical protein
MNGPVLVHYLLLLAALVCFFLGFVRYREAGPVTIGWLGLALWMLDILIFAGKAG